MIKRWKWSADDQNYVANLIAGKHMDPAKAAEQWVKANPARSRPGWASSTERRGRRRAAPPTASLGESEARLEPDV